MEAFARTDHTDQESGRERPAPVRLVSVPAPVEEPKVGRAAAIGAAIGFVVAAVLVSAVGVAMDIEVASAIGLGVFVGSLTGVGFGFMMGATLTVVRHMDD